MSLRIAIAQILPTRDLKLRAEQVNTWIGKAADARADVVVFPEVVWSVKPQSQEPEFLERNIHIIEEGDRQIVQRARDLQLAIIVGTSRRSQGGWHNSLLIMDKTARPPIYYDKLHRAEPWSVAGEAPIIYDLCGIPSCLLVCYDWRFPEITRLCAIAGAQIGYCCSYHDNPSCESKMSAYSALPTARAAENTIFFVSATPAANANDLQAGSHGHSRIIDPIGNTLAEGMAFAEQLIIADIDPAKATRQVALRALNDAGPLQEWITEGVKLVEKR